MDQISIWEVINQDAVTVASLLTTATASITTAVGSVWDIMTGNVWLSFMVGASVLAVGFRFFRNARFTAGG